MAWTWHWWLFLVLLIPAYILVAFGRGANNEANVAKYGVEADYKYGFATQPGSIMTGTFVAGAVWAAIATAVAGFFF